MVPVSTGGYRDLDNILGLAGQNSSQLAEKAFNLHFIVQLSSAVGNQYFDPSYGVTYAKNAGFESQAVFGSPSTWRGRLEAWEDRAHLTSVRRAPLLSSNIVFTTVAGKSM